MKSLSAASLPPGSAIRLLLLFGLLVFPMIPRTALGVVLGQVDTFQDGTVQGWTDPAANTSKFGTGGPAGVNDNYLQIVSGTFGGGSRLTAFNRTQWLGNYLVVA